MLKDYELQIEFTDMYNLRVQKYWTCSAIINNTNTHTHTHIYIYIYIYNKVYVLSGVFVLMRQGFQ